MEDSAKRRTVNFEVTNDIEAQPVKIISDPGMAALRERDGAVIPMVQIDAGDRNDIRAFFRAHARGFIGEAACQWGLRDGAPAHTVTLFLEFSAPMRLLMFMDFHVVRQGFLVEEILRTREIYIQAIGPADVTSSLAETLKIHVTVPDSGFRPIWNEMLGKELTQDFRARGMSARAARARAAALIDSWRQRPS